MATGVVFLQSSLEDAPVTMGTYKAGNTELIRGMLREQQKGSRVLHANPLFKEFRGEGGPRQRKQGKGYAADGGGTAPPQFDDLQAEGQTRMFEVIRSTAAKEDKTCQGVWAEFGKPYVCLGQPTEPNDSLPKLYRDELEGREQRGPGGKGFRKGRAQREQHQHQQQQRDQQKDQQGAAQGPPHTSHSGTTFSRGGGSRDSVAQQAAGLEEPSQEQIEAEQVLKRHQSSMKFGTVDRWETMFPPGPLKTAEQRTLRAKASTSVYIDRAEAAADVGSPAKSYGAIPHQQRSLVPLPKKAGAAGDLSAAGSFFLTQAGSVHHSEEDVHRHSHSDARSLRTSVAGGGRLSIADGLSRTSVAGHFPGAQMNGVRQADMSVSGYRPSNAGTLHSSFDAMSMSSSHAGMTKSHPGDDGRPPFEPAVDLAIPARGDESNPVYKWHNDFVSIRQHGRKELQTVLHQRSEARYRARTMNDMAAGVSNHVMANLRHRAGSPLGYVALGHQPVSPFKSMEALSQEQAAARNNARKEVVVKPLDAAELRVLQRFYDQLCALVEQQRMSDPLCLMIIHKVKSLLEVGLFLHSPMLIAVLEHIATFTKSCGLVRYNKYVLAVLTFLAKCVGHSEQELEDFVTNLGICVVVYNSKVPPSKQPAADALPPAEEAVAARPASVTGGAVKGVVVGGSAVVGVDMLGESGCHAEADHDEGINAGDEHCENEGSEGLVSGEDAAQLLRDESFKAALQREKAERS